MYLSSNYESIYLSIIDEESSSDNPTDCDLSETEGFTVTDQGRIHNIWVNKRNGGRKRISLNNSTNENLLKVAKPMNKKRLLKTLGISAGNK